MGSLASATVVVGREQKGVTRGRCSHPRGAKCKRILPQNPGMLSCGPLSSVTTQLQKLGAATYIQPDRYCSEDCSCLRGLVAPETTCVHREFQVAAPPRRSYSRVRPFGARRKVEVNTRRLTDAVFREKRSPNLNNRFSPLLFAAKSAR